MDYWAVGLEVWEVKREEMGSRASVIGDTIWLGQNNRDLMTE
jgi:hypothetical protein